MTLEKFALIYSIGYIISNIIFTARAIMRKPAQDPGPLDAIWWLFAWWFLLPIFLVRWTKYKLKGKDL